MFEGGGEFISHFRKIISRSTAQKIGCVFYYGIHVDKFAHLRIYRKFRDNPIDHAILVWYIYWYTAQIIHIRKILILQKRFVLTQILGLTSFCTITQIFFHFFHENSRHITMRLIDILENFHKFFTFLVNLWWKICWPPQFDVYLI